MLELSLSCPNCGRRWNWDTAPRNHEERPYCPECRTSFCMGVPVLLERWGTYPKHWPLDVHNV